MTEYLETDIKKEESFQVNHLTLSNRSNPVVRGNSR
jgi:hypothetical protein